MAVVSRFLAIVVLSITGLAAVGAGLLIWARDVHNDRRHTITTLASTPVFAGPGNRDCDTHHPIRYLRPGTTARVKRIRYLKDCATVDMDDAAGQRVRIVLGIGNVAIQPPLGME